LHKCGGIQKLSPQKGVSAERSNHLHVSAYSLLIWFPLHVSANINSEGV